MQFSVVIPTYNRVDLLARTLASVWRQRFTDYEVIVVDDGSTDGTQEYLQNLGDRVRFATQANRGPGAARNVGVLEARGEYIAFLDSDDLWFPWTLEVFADAIKEHGNPHILNGNFVEFTDDADLVVDREESFKSSWFCDCIASSRNSYMVGSGTCVLRKGNFAKTKFLEDRLNAEDHDLILRMGALPGFVQILSPTTLACRRHFARETGNFFNSVYGTLRLLAREKAGVYAGGSKRSVERRRILTRHSRPVSLACIREGALMQGWKIYKSTLGWNVKLGRWRYVLGFPLLVMLELLSRVTARERSPL